jgi:hypothetical protein
LLIRGLEPIIMLGCLSVRLKARAGNYYFTPARRVVLGARAAILEQPSLKTQVAGRKSKEQAKTKGFAPDSTTLRSG